MARFFESFGRILVTLVAVVLALFGGFHVWDYYMDAPWTRDARIRADVVQVAPDVSGLVSKIEVEDNERVKKGDVIFIVDQVRFQIAVEQAAANVMTAKATLDQAERDQARYTQLTSRAVSDQKREEIFTARNQALGAYKLAVANLDKAKLDLERSEVRARVNGYMANFEMQPGVYVNAGKGVAALVDSDSFYIMAYFEETKLPRISVGDEALIYVMGETKPIRGEVESIVTGIEDRERGGSETLLANINPTFNWVRLAQRVPVRISIKELPEGLKLVSGRTATVYIQHKGEEEAHKPFPWNLTEKVANLWTRATN
ncbi:efflux RND transporter periplasmic adaptor subunit [Beijerinckia indica]|uniref:Efflux transporter, RND family, MFP subunit n=1 Tax=Beijerinckia indica subsp. indica (strain ATCC 9039 / DSM 1715 / NCIMB 8712) TaxID=395963 RepID=B2IHF0_BEII9|nr:HlyD family secretion protein [Beijerinckia indica]ACB95935.1 efflux transporter, RND family, MFP subunit [Beijerinckia indica subsp. indica ATCC 9039]